MSDTYRVWAIAASAAPSLPMLRTEPLRVSAIRWVSTIAGARVTAQHFSEIANRLRRSARNGERLHLDHEHVIAILTSHIYPAIAELESEEIASLCQPPSASDNSGSHGAPTGKSGPSAGTTAPLYAQSSGDMRALEGYRAAVSFIGADSWDGCPDCIEILRAARMADHDWHWTPDETAEALKRLRQFAPANRDSAEGV